VCSLADAQTQSRRMSTVSTTGCSSAAQAHFGDATGKVRLSTAVIPRAFTFSAQTNRHLLPRKSHTRLELPAACSRDLQVAIARWTQAAGRKPEFAAAARGPFQDFNSFAVSLGGGFCAGNFTYTP